MTLDAYLRDTADTAEALASRVGTTGASISRIRRGEQNITLDLAKRIVAETGGSVTLDDLADVRLSDAA